MSNTKNDKFRKRQGNGPQEFVEYARDNEENLIEPKYKVFNK